MNKLTLVTVFIFCSLFVMAQDTIRLQGAIIRSYKPAHNNLPVWLDHISLVMDGDTLKIDSIYIKPEFEIRRKPTFYANEKH